MIVNECTLSQEDAVFLTKCIIAYNMKTPRKRFSAVILLLLGLLFLVLSALCLWVSVPQGRYHGRLFFQAFLYGIIGCFAILSLIFGKQIALWRVMHAKAWNTIAGTPFKTVIDGETVTTFRSANGTDTQSRYALSLIEGFCVQDGSTYLWVTADNLKKIIVLRDDSYTEGSKEALLSLLHQRGIPVHESP